MLPPETARDPIPGPAKRIKEEWRNDSVGDVTKNVPFDLPTGRKLADSAFDPDTVAMMGDAFDTAWGMIEPAFMDSRNPR